MCELVSTCILQVVGTEIEPSVPLMTAGFDSLQATELQRALSDLLSTELEGTLLFDHPSVGGIVSLLTGSSSGLKDRPNVFEPAAQSELILDESHDDADDDAR